MEIHFFVKNQKILSVFPKNGDLIKMIQELCPAVYKLANQNQESPDPVVVVKTDKGSTYLANMVTNQYNEFVVESVNQIKAEQSNNLSTEKQSIYQNIKNEKFMIAKIDMSSTKTTLRLLDKETQNIIPVTSSNVKEYKSAILKSFINEALSPEQSHFISSINSYFPGKSNEEIKEYFTKSISDFCSYIDTKYNGDSVINITDDEIENSVKQYKVAANFLSCFTTIELFGDNGLTALLNYALPDDVEVSKIMKNDSGEYSILTSKIIYPEITDTSSKEL